MARKTLAGTAAPVTVVGFEEGALPDSAAIGSTADAAASSTVPEDATPRTGISLWKGIKNVLLLVRTILGATNGVAVVTDADGTLQQYLRGLVSLVAARLPALGQAAMAGSQPVVIANNQSAVPVSGPLTDTQLRATAVPVSAAQLPAALGQAAMAASLPVVMASDQSAVPVVDDYTPTEVADVTAADSDKTFTVTALKVWLVEAIHVLLTSTATVGNRQMTVDITDDGGNVLARVRAGATQAASLAYSYTFGIGLDKDVAPIALHLTAPLPQMSLLAGWKIRVYDSAAIAAAADGMTVEMVVAERAA
jgi:hypothetical protein